MTRIVARVGSDALSVLLRSDAARELREFLNLAKSEDVFDRLWSDDEGFEFAIIEDSEIGIDDLINAANNNSGTKFFVYDPAGTCSANAPNVVIATSLDYLQRALSA